jgi:hypothetical protein
LAKADLRWFVSQQPPTDDKAVNTIDVTADVEKLAATDHHLLHIKAFNLPPQDKKLVISTAGIVELGELLAHSYLSNQ